MAGAPSKFRRFLVPRLREALTDTPVVLIHGPRQSGKTTLARMVGERRGYRYFSFDDEAARQAAQTDPTGFVADLPERVILDEVQRVPALFTALKAAVDRTRVAGRFILTGSANVLLREGGERKPSAHGAPKRGPSSACAIAQNAGVEHLIHGSDGQIRARNSYGNNPYTPKANS